MIETYRGTIYPWHCDHMGHMNVRYYAAKFDEATWQLFNSINLTPAYLRDRRRGMVAVDQRTRYKAELLPGDVITIRSKITKVKKKSICFSHIMIKSDTNEIAAETELTGVHIDTARRKSCEFETEISGKISQLGLEENN